MAESGVRKPYKEQLKPTPTQERALERVLWRCRTLYHTALEQRIFLDRQRGSSVTRYQQEAALKALRADLPDFASIHSQVLQDRLARLDKTSQAFFRRVQAGEKSGFPRFQGSKRSHSYTSKEVGNGARLDNGFLVLSKIGRVRVRWSRPLAGIPKTVTLSHAADGGYVSFSGAAVPTPPLAETGRETGVDVGRKVFLVTAAGDVVANPRHYRTAEQQLAKAQKRVSRRKKGSTRRKKAVALCAKNSQHVRRPRCDFHHTTALALVRQYDVIIYHEALQPANLSRCPPPMPAGNGGHLPNGAARKAGLNKSIHDAGGGSFRSIRTFKAACAGKRVEAVNPASTSPDCSGCGARIPQSLAVRTHVCTNCGLVLDRAENAARTSHWRGQRLRGVLALAGAMNREPVGL